MDWNELIYSRHSFNNFNMNEVIPEEHVEKLMNDLCATLPSKQGRYPYFIDVFNWSNKDLRLWMYEYCTWIDKDSSNHKPFNKQPQMAAPLLITFTVPTTPITDLPVPEADWPIGVMIDNVAQSHMEVGMAAMHIVHAAYDLGYQAGFCGCIPDPSYFAKKIGYDNHQTWVCLGIGTKPNFDHNPEAEGYWRCPVDGIVYKRGVHSNQPRPEVGKFIKYHN